MQCLFCGKELALLKRLRGGAEFCSEAHRKEYQDQYEQLALARLLQAKQPVEPAAPLGRPAPPPPAETPRVNVPAPTRQDPQVQSPRAVARPTMAMIEAPAARPTAEEAGPAPLAGFLKDSLVPAVTSFVPAGPLELMVASSTPSFPKGGSSASSATSEASGQEGSLLPAPRVEFGFSLQALDHHTRKSERGVELREFAGPAPLIELHLRPETAAQPVATADVMEILMSPHPPQKATPWLGAPRGFPAAPAELGDLARLDFTTTGFAYSDGAASASAVEIAESPQAAPAQAAPEPVSRPEPPAQLAPETPAVSEVVVASEPVEAPAATEVTQAEVAVPAEQAPPALVTKALPVTLHGLAAPRGKLADTFTTAIVPASDVRIPVSAALPLRPTIVFGPVPAPPASASPAPVPALTPATAAPQQPVPENPPSQLKSAMIPLPKGVTVKRPNTPESPAQERKAPQVAASAPVEKPIEKRVEPRPELRPEPRPELHVEPRTERQTERPVATAYDAVPSLHLQTTESAWSRLSTGLKIGIAAALIAGVAGIAFVVTRGGSKAATPAPAATSAPAAASVASGVPISGGWIDDWANASKTRRRISLLSGSAKLSDYRMEFLAQIESKAVGWVFRGQNPRNYYVAKLETTKPGLEPTVALVHFAVVDGQDENRVAVPLPMKVRLDTTYKIRFEAIGNRFTAWVQDQKIDEWTDSRFGSGGVGLFSEREERTALQGNVNVIALVPKN